MYREIMAGNIGALATTAMLVVGSLFTIFSGSLFQALAVPNSGLVALRANQSFVLSPSGNSDYNDKADGAGSISSLILESNLSYPSFTYRDLAFPQLVLDTPGDSNSTFDLSTVTIEATVPAVRSKLDCRLYDSSKHRFNHTRNYTLLDTHNPLGVWIAGEECRLFPQYEQSKYNSLFSTFSNTTYIGMGKETVCEPGSLFPRQRLPASAGPMLSELVSRRGAAALRSLPELGLLVPCINLSAPAVQRKRYAGLQ